MQSALPKVLHPIAGRPIVDYVVQAAFDAGTDDVVVVVGHGAEAVVASLGRSFGDRVRSVVQAERRGTGHAAMVGLEAVDPAVSDVLVLCGDTPLLQASDLVRLLAALRGAPHAPLAMLTCSLSDPTGYGRVLRNHSGDIVGVREQRDASGEEVRIKEVNPAVYAARSELLRRELPRLRPDNAQGELYLTDIVAVAAVGGGVTGADADATTLSGINDRAQLHAAEERLIQRINEGWRRRGVTIRGAARIDATVLLEQDVIIEHGAVLRGRTRVGSGAVVDVGAVLTDAEIGPGVNVKPYSVVTSSTAARAAQIGPFSHLRPGSVIGAEAHVGNFVETKNTVLGPGAKANHLAYLGDGDVGARANIGAGTIFCNYDGFRKHRTVIGEGAFIGSDSQLIAPVNIGAGAYVATGTTVTKDVPADDLAIARVRQENKPGYAKALRERLAVGDRKPT